MRASDAHRKCAHQYVCRYFNVWLPENRVKQFHCTSKFFKIQWGGGLGGGVQNLSKITLNFPAFLSYFVERLDTHDNNGAVVVG